MTVDGDELGSERVAEELTDRSLSTTGLSNEQDWLVVSKSRGDEGVESLHRRGPDDGSRGGRGRERASETKEDVFRRRG